MDNRRFTRRADLRLPPGCYSNLIINVKRGQSWAKRACGVYPDRHDWATFTISGGVHSCCTVFQDGPCKMNFNARLY